MIDFLLGVPGKLKTISDYLTTNWTTTRAAKVDNLDAAVTTRAAASTALTNATWTDTRAAKIDTINTLSAAGVIKSIQTGYVSTLSSSGSGEDLKYANVTIASVTSSKSVVILAGGAPGAFSVVTGRLTSATVLRISCPESYSSVAVRWTVLEFN